MSHEEYYSALGVLLAKKVHPNALPPWIGLPRFSEEFLKHFPEAKVTDFVAPDMTLKSPKLFDVNVGMSLIQLDSPKGERQKFIALIHLKSEKNPRPGDRYIAEMENENE